MEKNCYFVSILHKLIREGKDSKKIRQILLHWCYELTLSRYFRYNSCLHNIPAPIPYG